MPSAGPHCHGAKGAAAMQRRGPSAAVAAAAAAAHPAAWMRLFGGFHLVSHPKHMACAMGESGSARAMPGSRTGATSLLHTSYFGCLGHLERVEACLVCCRGLPCGGARLLLCARLCCCSSPVLMQAPVELGWSACRVSLDPRHHRDMQRGTGCLAGWSTPRSSVPLKKLCRRLGSQRTWTLGSAITSVSRPHLLHTRALR